MNALLERLFPKQVDNRFDDHGAALWLLGLFVALKLVMSVNSMVNTTAIAAGADGLPLSSFGAAEARAVLMLFALMSLGQLTLALIALTMLTRCRAMVPFVYLVLLGEQIARHVIVQSYAVARTDGIPVGWYVNLGLLALLTTGLVLSPVPVRKPTVGHEGLK